MKPYLTHVCLAVLLGVSTAVGQDAPAKKLTVTIDAEPIQSALNRLGRMAGTTIVLSRSAIDMLPYGARTRVRIRATEATLESILRDLERRLGLQRTTAAESIRLEPVPALARLGRRATNEELDLVAKLRTRTWDRIKAELNFTDAEQAARLIATIAARPELGKKLAVEALDEGCKSLKWNWIPEGGRIALVTPAVVTQKGLDRVIALNELRRPLTDVLGDLAKKADMVVAIAPNALDGVDPQTLSSFSIIAPRIAVRDALDKIAEIAQLTWSFDPAGGKIIIDRPKKTTPNLPPPARDRVVGKWIPAPAQAGHGLEWFVRQSEAYPELQALRERTIREALSTALLGGFPGTRPVPSAGPAAMDQEAMIGKVNSPIQPDGSHFEFFIYPSDLTLELRALRLETINRAAATRPQARAATTRSAK